MSAREPEHYWVTVEHLRDAVRAGIADALVPVRREVAELRAELHDLRASLDSLSRRFEQRTRWRVWAARRATNLLDKVGGLAVAAVAGAALTFLLTHL